MDAFTARLGTSEGRFAPAPGEIVFVLGDLEPGRTAELAPGDYVEIAQMITGSDVALVRVTGTLRAPETGRWRASLRVGGEERAALDAWPGRTRIVTDLAARVPAHPTAMEVAVRLTFLGS